MSCWVVPALAAEIWGISLQQVLDAIRAGSVPTRSSIGLTFVDVAPASPKLHPGCRPPAARPRTYRETALIDEPSAKDLGALNDESSGGSLADEKELTSTIDEHEEGRLDWRASRRAAAKLRRPPMHRAA